VISMSKVDRAFLLGLALGILYVLCYIKADD
jgi:hypothetical protein